MNLDKIIIYSLTAIMIMLPIVLSIWDDVHRHKPITYMTGK